MLTRFLLAKIVGLAALTIFLMHLLAPAAHATALPRGCPNNECTSIVTCGYYLNHACCMALAECYTDDCWGGGDEICGGGG